MKVDDAGESVEHEHAGAPFGGERRHHRGEMPVVDVYVSVVGGDANLHVEPDAAADTYRTVYSARWRRVPDLSAADVAGQRTFDRVSNPAYRLDVINRNE